MSDTPEWPEMLDAINSSEGRVRADIAKVDKKVDRLDNRVLTVENARIADEAGRKTWFQAMGVGKALVLAGAAVGGLVLGVFNAIG
jgi:uncharacterized protein involved in exopolysaccharide biosynthesis